ncbi:unnamed protein product [Leptidea sinapis]|uniref:Uncharacterized protein n=1 Tax=Leptidea sinapis TaxID=189913 RepID=A0A5E4QCE3_9NEOP|nr:unnamed protein product [Leptidea sinapis]
MANSFFILRYPVAQHVGVVCWDDGYFCNNRKTSITAGSLKVPLLKMVENMGALNVPLSVIESTVKDSGASSLSVFRYNSSLDAAGDNSSNSVPTVSTGDGLLAASILACSATSGSSLASSRTFSGAAVLTVLTSRLQKKCPICGYTLAVALRRNTAAMPDAEQLLSLTGNVFAD